MYSVVPNGSNGVPIGGALVQETVQCRIGTEACSSVGNAKNTHGYLADPGVSRGCSTNCLVIDSVSE